MTSPARLLLIHDDPAVADAMVSALEELEHEVVVARSAAVAIRDLRAAAPVVVITRDEMPMLGGRHLLRAVATVDPDIPVILVGDARDPEEALEWIRLGAFDCVYDVSRRLGVLVGAVERAVARAGPIRERRRLDAELAESHARMTRLLEQQTVIRSRAIDRVAEPLDRVVKGLLELQKGELLPEQHAQIDAILRAAFAVSDELESADTDASKTSTRSMQLEDFHPQAVLEFVRDAIVRDAHAQGTEIALHVAPDLPALRGDPQQLRVALADLARYLLRRRTGGVVAVSTSVLSRGPGPWIVAFDLTDADVSVPIEGPNVLDRHLPGENVETARDEVVDLSLAARAVEMLGGELELFEARGSGLRFRFDLALLKAKRPDHELDDPGLPASDVLLIEPCGPVRRGIANELTRLGMRCTAASTAEQGVAALMRAFDHDVAYAVAFISLALPERAEIDDCIEELGAQAMARIYLAGPGELAPSPDARVVVRPPRRDTLIDVLRTNLTEVG